jgi:hypothetical protein
MLVKDLIKTLQTLPPNAEVFYPLSETPELAEIIRAEVVHNHAQISPVDTRGCTFPIVVLRDF